VDDVIAAARFPAALTARIANRATVLVKEVRRQDARRGTLDAFLQEFGLSTREGVALMCLAESLLRIPDSRTTDALIRDKIGGGDWERHPGHTDDVFVNASTWALMLTGRVIRLDCEDGDGPGHRAVPWLHRHGAPYQYDGGRGERGAGISE
jgi:RHH-type proline utilization regulon transcriptional repressor/proline dehydrogenase/delta 1-pyrroline-5-carboxylate dehydrogenase